MPMPPSPGLIEPAERVIAEARPVPASLALALLTFTLLLLAMLDPVPSNKVPAEMVVAPSVRAFAPFRVRVPVPILVSDPRAGQSPAVGRVAVVFAHTQGDRSRSGGNVLQAQITVPDSPTSVAEVIVVELVRPNPRLRNLPRPGSRAV